MFQPLNSHDEEDVEASSVGAQRCPVIKMQLPRASDDTAALGAVRAPGGVLQDQAHGVAWSGGTQHILLSAERFLPFRLLPSLRPCPLPTLMAHGQKLRAARQNRAPQNLRGAGCRDFGQVWCNTLRWPLPDPPLGFMSLCALSVSVGQSSDSNQQDPARWEGATSTAGLHGTTGCPVSRF